MFNKNFRGGIESWSLNGRCYKLEMPFLFLKNVKYPTKLAYNANSFIIKMKYFALVSAILNSFICEKKILEKSGF